MGKAMIIGCGGVASVAIHKCCQNSEVFTELCLASRTKALLRRAHGTTTSQGADLLVCGPLTLDAASHKAFAQGAEVTLTLKEFSLLQELMEHPGRVLSRSQLLEHVWGWAYTENTRTVDVHIQTLRQKLAQVAPGCDSLIKTVRGIGYALEA